MPGHPEATAEGLPPVVARCICKHVLQSVGLSQEEAHLLITPVDGGEVLQQHQEALSSNTKTSSHGWFQRKPSRDLRSSGAEPRVISRSEPS